jgi:predicted XRE-type DNA-binding protein
MKTKPIITRTASQLAELLDLSPADALELELRRQLNDKIIQGVHDSGITHAQLAKLANTSRSRLTAILNRNTSHVSTDLLLRILSVLGYRLTISFSRRRRAA